jgi:hypothetical protein
MLMTWSKRGATVCAAVAHIKACTRQRFALSADCTIFAVEVACGRPGCRPESVIVFWTAPNRRQGFKVFKPIEAVVEDELPSSWMKGVGVADEPADRC